ncbi:hypothetical protein GCM10020220_095130 [Nonomuraea rubra]
MLTRTAAVELAPRGIRVNAVLPGVFVTPLLQDLPAEQLRPRIERAPMARPGDPADVAGVARAGHGGHARCGGRSCSAGRSWRSGDRYEDARQDGVARGCPCGRAPPRPFCVSMCRPALLTW